MHSSEPIEPHFEDDSSHQAVTDESWRAELASRVHSYRNRRRSNTGDEGSMALDFGPPAAGPSFEFRGADSQKFPLEERPGSTVPRNAFDTNYYRRLNAESFAQSTSPIMGATVAATELSPEGDPEPGAGLDAEFEAERSAGASGEACNDLVLDLELRPSAADDSFLEGYRISGPEPEAEPAAAQAPPMPEAQPDSQPTSATQGNLIVFRRPLLEPPLVPQPSRDELAEPMNNRPRILEVPEDIMPPVQGSLFPEIRLDSDEQEDSESRTPEFETPLPVALVSERLIAAFADIGIVITADLLFAGMALRALPEIPHTKPFWMVLAAVSLLLWAVYQHMFLLYAGRTPGMSMRGIRLKTFAGQAPGWEQRTIRARYIFISFASVALGFVWALVDEDTLCWHDRLSQTFPTTE